MNSAIIILSGKMQSGKSTSAELIKEIIKEKIEENAIKQLNKEKYELYNYSVEIHSFAKKLKEIASDLFDWNGDKNLYVEKDKGRNVLINIGQKMREIREL